MSVHKIICGKSEIELKQFDDDSFDSCVCDPPYGLEFMGKDWDKFGISESRAAYLSSTRKQDCDYKLKGEGRYSDMTLKEKKTFQQFTYQWATALYRVMKPGAHILVFGGDRTEHRMKCAVEDAGFEIRGTIVWVYASGFPKSLDISKSLDKMNGVEHPVGEKINENIAMSGGNHTRPKMEVQTEEAIQWNGWGTGLKPAVELICMARKPISERNIAANVLKWGVGGINVDGCRIKYQNKSDYEATVREGFLEDIRGGKYGSGTMERRTDLGKCVIGDEQGRFPANLILECCCEDDELVEGKACGAAGHWSKSTHWGTGFNTGGYAYQGIDEKDDMKCLIHTNPNCVCRMLDEQSGQSKSVCIEGGANRRAYQEYEITNPSGWKEVNRQRKTEGFNDTGGCSRFFYQAKASQNERWFYCTICKQAYPMKERDNHIHNAPEKTKYQYLEFHPTQKPEDLICYLMRLITPPNGTAIDPFLGSGTALIAAGREGFNCVGIDSKPEYCEIAYKRGKSELVQQKISGEQSTIERIGF